MSYRIILSDGTTLDVSDERGEKLKELKLNGRSSQTVEVNDNVFELNRIKSIKHIYEQPISEAFRIDMTRCRGQRSIQFYMMKVIRKQHGKDWSRYFRDFLYREKLRKQIHEQKQGDWCDVSENTCACASDYKATPDRVSEIHAMFPGAKTVTEVE